MLSKRLCCAAVRVCLLVLFQACAVQSNAMDKIIAVVNNDVITQKDLDDFINFTRMEMAKGKTPSEFEAKSQEIRKDLLDRLIDDKLILQEAKRSGFIIEPSRVKARLDEIKKRYSSDREFQDTLIKEGLVQADIEKRIKDQIMMYLAVENNVRLKIAVAPDEVTSYYNAHKDKFSSTEKRDIESLSVSDLKAGREIVSKLRSGIPSADVAREYAVEVNAFSAQSGQLKKEIETAVFALKVGEVSDPLELNGRYYIFKVNNLIPPRQETLAEVQDEIYKFLYDKKTQEALVKWLDELRKRSYIKIF